MLQQNPTEENTGLSRTQRLAPQMSVNGTPGARASHCLLLWLLSLEFHSSMTALLENSSSAQNPLAKNVRATVQKIPALLMSAGRQESAEDVCIHLKKAHFALLETVKLLEFSVEYGCVLPTDVDYRDFIKQSSALNGQLVSLIEAC